jgi:archaellum component FlaC
MTEKIGAIEERLQETIEGIQSTVDTAVGGFKQAQGPVEGAKTTTDHILESVEMMMDETIERVKTTTDLVNQAQQHPWIMMGSAVLMGYIVAKSGR